MSRERKRAASATEREKGEEKGEKVWKLGLSRFLRMVRREGKKGKESDRLFARRGSGGEKKGLPLPLLEEGRKGRKKRESLFRRSRKERGSGCFSLRRKNTLKEGVKGGGSHPGGIGRKNYPFKRDCRKRIYLSRWRRRGGEFLSPSLTQEEKGSHPQVMEGDLNNNNF